MIKHLASVVLVLAVASLAAATVGGAPTPLPGLALGSTVVLYAERAAALFALSVACLTVLAQATGGRLPVQVSTGGLTYEATAHATEAIDEVLAQLSRLEADVVALSERVDADQRPV